MHALAATSAAALSLPAEEQAVACPRRRGLAAMGLVEAAALHALAAESRSRYDLAERSLYESLMARPPGHGAGMADAAAAASSVPAASASPRPGRWP
jgi:hypothetical protein